MRLLPALLCIVTQAGTSSANVEKNMFVGPSPVALPNVPPSLDGLRLPALSPLHSILATQLRVHAPSAPTPRRLESWYLLRDLQPGQRYEVRICWPATVSALAPSWPASCLLTAAQQPTDFWLDTYPIAHLLDTPPLLASLAHHRRHSTLDDKHPAEGLVPETTQSVLLLRIQAAASYYSANQTLMDHPPPVDVDISA